MGEFSLTHLVIVALIFLIFFRKDQLPSMGKSIGKAIRGFKEGITEIDVDAKDVHDDTKKNSANQQSTATTAIAQNSNSQPMPQPGQAIPNAQNQPQTEQVPSGVNSGDGTNKNGNKA